MRAVATTRRATAWRWALYLVATWVLSGCAHERDLLDEPLKPNTAQVLADAGLETPTEESPWLPAPVPDWRPGKPMVWYRVVFDAPQARPEAWALYLPYLYGGGKVVLNGVDVEQIGSLASGLWVRWERPHLVVLPDALVRTGRNVLLLRVERSPIGNSPVLAPLQIGRRSVLQDRFDRRLFIVTTLPQFTVIACAVTAVFMFFIFWRRRSEVLFGLFGLAVLMWGARTLTFVIEVLPAAWWPVWRTVYFASTGGFVIALMLFTMRMAGHAYPRVEFALMAYWALGPLAYVISGNEALLATYWVGGLVPVGIALGVFAALGAWQQRSAANIAVALALAIGVLCGVHDYWVAVGSGKLLEWVPAWAEQRYFALHHGANLMLLMMGTVLSGRFLGALRQVEDVNRTLEARIAAREQELDASYRSLAGLQRVQAAADERALIVRDLHDGLGSALFASLARIEGGRMAAVEVAQMLRECIAEMRLVFEAMPPEERDFSSVLGSFRFRWHQLLQTQGIESDWQVDIPIGAVQLTPQGALQVLRVLQEALTNVLKHARATRICVSVSRGEGGGWCVQVEDNGIGVSLGDVATAGRGMGNMQRRAQRLGAALSVRPAASGGTRVVLELPADEAGGA